MIMNLNLKNIDSYKAKKEEYKDKGFFQTKYKIEGKFFIHKLILNLKKNSHYTSSLTEKGGSKTAFNYQKIRKYYRQRISRFTVCRS